MSEKRLIRNAFRTPDGTILDSTHRHDYKSYKDQNGKTYMNDGGLDYMRRSMNGDEIDVSLYDDQPHEVQREVLKWGTYGKEGDQPKVYKPVSIMDTEHIEIVLEEYGSHMMPVLKDCMEKELELRK